MDKVKTESTQRDTPESIPPSNPQSKFLLPLFAVLLLGMGLVGGYYISRNTSGNPVYSPPQIPQPTQAVNANIKTYQNAVYNFSFQYPTDLFIYQHPPQQEAQYWSNKANGGSPMELGTDGVWMNMVFSNPGSSLINFYKKIMDLPINGTLSENGVTKLSNITTNGVQGVTYFQGVPPNFVGGGPAYSYEALWIQDNFVYRLTFSTFSEAKLTTYKPTFDQIVNSFKFEGK